MEGTSELRLGRMWKNELGEGAVHRGELVQRGSPPLSSAHSDQAPGILLAL